MSFKQTLAFWQLLFAFVTSAQAEIYGNLGLESRLFAHSPVGDEQERHNASLLGSLQAQASSEDGDLKGVLNAFVRLDSADSERSHADFRELFTWRNFGSWELSAGIKKVFWGVTESVHVVDIINQTDTLENIDGEDKLGQAMLEFSSQQDWGYISAFVLPHFREREYPGSESRLRSALPIAEDALFEDSNEKQHIDLALRYSHYVGAWDFGLAHFSGTQREPIFLAQPASSGGLELVPFYYQIDQSSLDVQATLGAALFKVEAASIRRSSGHRNTCAALGLEYVFFSAFNDAKDLSIVTEYQFDDRPLIQQSTAQNDIVLGARLAFNDMDASELLILVSQDLDDNDRLFSLETSRRLSHNWTVEAELRIFSGAEAATPEYDVREDDYLQLVFKRFF